MSAAIKVLNLLLDGKSPDEPLIRTAIAELSRNAKPPAQVTLTETAGLPRDEVLKVLAHLFVASEGLVAALCRKHGRSIVIDGDLADALIEARRTLNKCGYEGVAYRSKDPISLTRGA